MRMRAGRRAWVLATGKEASEADGGTSLEDGSSKVGAAAGATSRRPGLVCMPRRLDGAK